MKENNRKGRGRPSLPPGEKRQKSQVSIPPNVLARAKEVAEQTGVSLSALVDKALREELMRHYFGESKADADKKDDCAPFISAAPGSGGQSNGKTA